MIRKMVLIVLIPAYAAFSCYLYEQIFFELFIGNRQSLYRRDELVFIALSFLIFCLLLPLSVFRFYPQHLNKVLFINIMIPIIFISIISVSNLGSYIGKPLYLQSELRYSDAIIISDTGNFNVRSLYAAELYRKGYANRIVTFAPMTGRFLDYLDNTLEIPREAIIGARENLRINTRNEALALRELGQKYGWKRALIVSDSFHMFRLMKALRRLHIKNIHPAGVPDRFYRIFASRTLGLLEDRPLSKLDFVQQMNFRHWFFVSVLHEYVGLCFYWLKGYI